MIFVDFQTLLQFCVPYSSLTKHPCRPVPLGTAYTRISQNICIQKMQWTFVIGILNRVCNMKDLFLAFIIFAIGIWPFFLLLTTTKYAHTLLDHLRFSQSSRQFMQRLRNNDPLNLLLAEPYFLFLPLLIFSSICASQIHRPLCHQMQPRQLDLLDHQ